MEILDIKNLTFTYPADKESALKDISLHVNEGDFILICGASGSGKTTLLRLLKSEISPYGKITGTISFKPDTNVAIVNQHAENQIVSDTVWHNLAFALESMNKPSFEIRQKIAEIAEFFDLSHLFRKNTSALSGGEKQLINLASVMVTDPDILILDEPTSQLDPICAKRFIDIIKRLNNELGLTIIISEHRTEELWNYATKVCILENGQLTYSGDGRNVDSEIDNEYIELPMPLKLYRQLDMVGTCPVTVAECRTYLSEHFKHDIDVLENCTKKHTAALKLKNIYFRYSKGGKDILEGLSFSCSFGEITTLLGGNGSGKTTLLSLISGINKPYYGKIENLGKKTAVLPQNAKAVFTTDSLRQDLALISQNYIDICQRLSITSLLDKNPYDLSGGELQKAALAKILLLEPDILCLDEPTKGIDAKGKRDIQKILKDLAEEGKGVIIVSHDADFSAEISDKCAFLFDGQIVSEGTPGEIFSTNKFYTTFASRISRHMYKNAVTLDNIITLCKRNGHY